MTEVMFGDHSVIIMENGSYKYDIKNRHEWDFSGGPVVKIPHATQYSHHKGKEKKGLWFFILLFLLCS